MTEDLVAPKNTQRVKRGKIFYGWWVVLAAAFVLFMLMYLLGTVVLPLIKQPTQKRSDQSSIRMRVVYPGGIV